jgi:hypothetical protein
MWIQDALPKAFPRCRIMLYGYEAKLDSQSTNRLSDYCTGLREELSHVRKTEEVCLPLHMICRSSITTIVNCSSSSDNKKERTRPMIFIAHSFGGIITANVSNMFH